MFDEKSKQELKYYVYILLDPADNKPFYVGKGTNNRVFDHMACALSMVDTSDLKFEKIREIVDRGSEVNHVIVRHGLSEKEAFQIEASLIDTLNYCQISLTNKVIGHNSIEKGLMTSDEIMRIYNAEPLNSIGHDCVLININKSYERGSGFDPIYNATKETWFISEYRLPYIKFVLSEYKGLIVEVFEVIEWYSKARTRNKTLDREKGITTQIEAIGYGFDGKIAPNTTRDLYINKSVAHLKKRGSAQVIRFNL